jgi:hypothetical protein
MGPLGGVRHDTYDVNWMYGTRMPLLDVRTWSRGKVPGLGLNDGSRLNMIDIILIPPKVYHFWKVN